MCIRKQMTFVIVCFHVIVGKSFKNVFVRVFQRCKDIYSCTTRYKRSVISCIVVNINIMNHYKKITYENIKP